MGIHNTEIFNNLALCCFYAQQYDMTLTCFKKALALATDQTFADVWYNIAHVALVCSSNRFLTQHSTELCNKYLCRNYIIYVLQYLAKQLVMLK